MKRQTLGLIELGLAAVLGIFGGVLLHRGLGPRDPFVQGITRADLVAIVGGVCLLAAIVALVRAVRDLVAGDRPP